jgi:peptidoglycan/xylan/chitin deacetylase (PgdA/CDA1 family)
MFKAKIPLAVLLFLFTALSTIACNNTELNKNTTDSTQPKQEKVIVAPPVNPDIAKFERKSFTYDSTKTYIYLTFDDGPHAATKQCFEICKQLGIKATFFMVGQHAKDVWGQQVVKTIRDAYPQSLLANHSYTHAKEKYKYFYQHPDMATADFYQAQQSLNVPYKIIRLPGNSAWVRKDEMKTSQLVRPVCKLLDSAGYNVIGWDVEWNFTRGTSYPVQSPQKMADQVNYAANGHSHTPKHVMILTHDRMFRTPAYADSLRLFITTLQKNPNYVFETVDHYPNLKF